MDALYPYQERALETLMKGRNIILVIPTGGGKTYTSCVPFFQNMAYNDGLLPGKALYAVPMRVLATQFQETCQKLLDDINPELLHALKTRYHTFGRELLSIQTGESPEDPLFESMITACTIDQLLASALGVPYTLGARRANMNVGAICGAYLILDEPHLYPLSHEGRSYQGAFTTCLELLRLLKGITRFVFMSATMSRELVKRLCILLDAELITVTDDELKVLNKERTRLFERASTPMDAEGILQSHTHCSLVICNTVQRAQEIYLKLHEQIQQDGSAIELHLLHSRFTDQDRAAKSDKLGQLLGKTQWQKGVYQNEKSVIVVATQVVEVGLDISVQTLHTELAPANSLVQRAGRCARFELQQGHVIIYPLPLDENGQSVSSLPYPASICAATWSALESYHGQVIGFREEQQLVDAVHTAADLDLLDRYENHRVELQEAITQSLKTHERTHVTDLIRDVTQVQLIIHNTPKEAITTEPWRWQNFSLHPSALQGKHWARLREQQASLELAWMCQKPELAPTERPDQPEQEEDSHYITTYTWAPLTQPAEVQGSLLIAMPNQLVTYDQDLGLVFLDGRLELSEEWQERLAAHDYQSTLLERKRFLPQGDATRMQCYADHIHGLADAYHYALYQDVAYTLRCLEQEMELLPGTIDHAIQLAIAAHDLGKLDRRWQEWARAWQRLYMQKTQQAAHYREPDASYFFAKTNYDYQQKKRKEQHEWQKELPSTIVRPPHACESVMIGRKMLAYSLGITPTANSNMVVLRALCYAIAHHHTSQAHEYGKTRLDTASVNAIQEAIEKVRREDHWTYDLAHLKLSFDAGDLFPLTVSKGLFTRPDVVSGPEERLETWLAFVLVRVLRLADQRAERYVPAHI